MLIAPAFRFALRLVCLASVGLISPALLAQGAVNAADGFDPNVDGNVYAVAVQPDGKVLIAGEFARLQPNGGIVHTPRGIARLLPDGRVDPTFKANMDINGRISVMVLQPDGRILIGGRFTSVNGVARNRIARLMATGELDESFDLNIGGGLTPDVNAIVLDANGGIVIGGGFTSVQPNGTTAPVTRNRVARFHNDGTLDTTFDPNVNGMVLSLAAQADGKVVIGGGFTKIQPNGAATAETRNRLARVNSNGTLDAAFNPNVNDAVNAIAIQRDGRIVIGGAFTTIQPPGTENAITVNRFCRLTPEGMHDQSFYGQATGQVFTIALQPDGGILVGGTFSAVGDGTRAYAARVRSSDGRLDTSFSAGANFNVYAFGVQSDGSIVLGGGFTALQSNGLASTPRNHVARVTASGGLDTDFRPDVNGRLRTVALQRDGKILVGGTFTSVGGLTRDSLVRLNADGSVDPSFTANVSGTVTTAVHLASGKILIGGSFSYVNGMQRANLARLNADGSVDTSVFNVVVGGAVSTIAEQSDGKVIIGGNFTFVRQTPGEDAITANYMVRLNAGDGAVDRTFTPGTNNAVNSIVLQTDGKILAGGSFTVVQGTGEASASRFSIARFNSNGTLDTAFGAGTNGSVTQIALDGDKVVIAGSFSLIGGTGATESVARNNIARLTATGAVDTAFDPNVNGSILALTRQSDGSFLIGGRFTSVGTDGDRADRNYVARLKSDGKVDTAFDLKLAITPGHEIVAFALPSAPANSMLVAGSFTLGGSGPLRRLARLTAAGALDPGFNADVNNAAGAQINLLTLRSDGRIFAGGSFSNINGANTSGLARFFPDGMADSSFLPTADGAVYSLAEIPGAGDPIPTQRSGFAWLESNGQIRSVNLPSAAPGSINAMLVQPDGKVLFAGDVTLDGSSRYGVIRLNPDGTADAAFQLKTVAGVRALALQSDGKILLGGSFQIKKESDSSTVEYQNVLRLNADGTIDTGFKQIVNSTVFTVAVQSDGKILAGGEFGTVLTAPSGTATTNRSRLARFNSDGAVDTTFNPSPNGTVYRLEVQQDGKILVGGDFSGFFPNGATTLTERRYIARLNADGTVDTPDLKANAVVLTIVRDSAGRYLIGGGFTQIHGQARNYIARVNADLTLDTSFNPNPNASVNAIALQGDKILVAGNFTAFQPNSDVFDPARLIPRNGGARLNDDGTVDGSFNPNFGAGLNDIVAHPNGSILARGSFTAIQPNGSLLIGGSFGSMNGIAVKNLALLGDDSSVSSTFLPNPDGPVYAIVPLFNGQFLVGGAFTTLSGTPRNRLARFNGTALDTSFNPNVNGDVYAVAVQTDGKILVGGNFTSIAGGSRSHLARLNADGSLDSSFNASVPGAVRVLMLQRDGRILYTSETGPSTNQLERLNADGSADSSFNADNNNAVYTVAPQADGRLYVGGSFTSIGGGNRSYFAALNANGSLDTTATPSSPTAGPNGAVTAMAVQPDGKIVIGGLFNHVDSLGRFGLARLGAPVPVVQSLALNSSGNTLTWSRSLGGPEAYAVEFEISTDMVNWGRLGDGSRVAGTGDWRITGLTLGSGVNYFARVRALVLSSPNTAVGQFETRTHIYRSTGSGGPAGAPEITSSSTASATPGSSFSYTITATGQPTSYEATGLPPGLTLNSVTGVISGTPTQTGTFVVTIRATNSLGSGSATLTITVAMGGGSGSSGPWHLRDVSCLAEVSSSRPLIVGFVVGYANKTVMLRGIGPGLATHGVTNGRLAEPRLTLDHRGTRVLQNTKWGGDSALAQLFAQLGLTPLDANSNDTAVAPTLNPGPYTIVIDPAQSGTSGVVLAEVYDAAGSASTQQFSAVSARGYVNAGGMLTGGFILSGDAPRRVLIRGAGPLLVKSGLTDNLADPRISVYRRVNGNEQLVAENNDWETPLSGGVSGAEIAAAVAATGPSPFDAGSKDAGVVVTLEPGIYTAQVTSHVSGGAGTALVEIYEVP